MKKYIKLIPMVLIAGGWILAHYGLAWGNPFGWTYELRLDTFTPSALMYVEDPEGRKAGADFSKPVNSAGEPTKLGIQWLQEIPHSFAEPDNFSGTPPTDWIINLYDASPATYTVYLKGLQYGTDDLQVLLYYSNSASNAFSTQVPYLTAPNVIRKILLDFKPSIDQINITRVVSSSDLLNDVQAACAQSFFVRSDRACRHLKLEAKLIEIALNHHREEEAEHLVRNFLWSLGIRKESHFFDIDRDHEERDYTSIKQPVLSVLQQDAQALLAQIEQGETSESKHNHSQGDNGNH
jgi:hypothetical protein